MISIHCFTDLTTHPLSIERADRPKLHDMFEARDANVWQREFPVGFPVEVSALNSIFINIFHDVVARIESRCVSGVTHVLIVGLLISLILRRKNFTRAEALLHFFPRKIERINRPTRHVFLQNDVIICNDTRTNQRFFSVAMLDALSHISASSFAPLP